MFFIIISAVHVSGGISAHHQELLKLFVQPWVLSCFPAVYRFENTNIWISKFSFRCHTKYLFLVRYECSERFIGRPFQMTLQMLCVAVALFVRLE